MVAAALILKIFCAWLLADAMSGVVHWVMDKRLSADGFFPGIVASNEVHHCFPKWIVGLTIRDNLSTSWAAVPIAAGLAVAGAPVILWLSFVFLFFGNLVHRWAHTPRRDCPRVVRWLQRPGIFQSQDHHAAHHYAGGKELQRSQTTKRYCVMSNYVNGLLERL